MTEANKTSETIFDGGDIEFIDIAALAIATALFVAQGKTEVMEAIGDMADSIKEGFTADEETTDEQQGD